MPVAEAVHSIDSRHCLSRPAVELRLVRILFVAPVSVGGVSLKPGSADFGTSTAHPAIGKLAAATATKAVLILPITRLLTSKSLAAQFSSIVSGHKLGFLWLRDQR